MFTEMVTSEDELPIILELPENVIISYENNTNDMLSKCKKSNNFST